MQAHQVNLSSFSSLVRKMARVLYVNPLVHLLIDFLIKKQNAELYTFCLLHDLEDEKTRK